MYSHVVKKDVSKREIYGNTNRWGRNALVNVGLPAPEKAEAKARRSSLC